MNEGLVFRRPSALQLSETIDELKKLSVSVVQLMERERVRLYGGGHGVLTPTDWSRLLVAVASLRALSVGRPYNDGVLSADLSRGGAITSRF